MIWTGSAGAQASPTWQTHVTDIAPTATTHSVTGLRPAHSYQFQVSAVNAVGRGDASSPSAVIKLPQQRKCHVSAAFYTTFHVLAFNLIKIILKVSMILFFSFHSEYVNLSTHCLTAIHQINVLGSYPV